MVADRTVAGTKLGYDALMNRRRFISFLGGAAASPLSGPLAARAQQAGKLSTIGFFGNTAASGGGPWTAAFVQRLRELGWVEGRTVKIEYRWAEGRSESYAEAAAEFVRLKADVIVSFGGATPTFKQATSVIPIVFTIDADPVGRGLVASLARPGGNVTGLSAQSTELVGKRLELMREILPDFRRLAVLVNVDFFGAAQELGLIRAAAGKLGIEIVDMLEVQKPEDIAPAFATLKGGAQVLYVSGDSLTNTFHTRINTLALGARLLTIHPNRNSFEGGGFISYGVNYADLHRRAADHVDKILRGAKPGDLPVEQPTKFEMVINVTVAKALGLKIAEAFLTRADEVIE
jgi:putative ABC transport system substrate-binding protein